MKELKNIFVIIICAVLSIFITNNLIGLNNSDGIVYWVVICLISLVLHWLFNGNDYSFTFTFNEDEDVDTKENIAQRKKDLNNIDNINIAHGVSKKVYPLVDVRQIDNHLYINGEEVRAIRFKDGSYKTIGQIIKEK